MTEPWMVTAVASAVGAVLVALWGVVTLIATLRRRQSSAALASGPTAPHATKLSRIVRALITFGRVSAGPLCLRGWMIKGGGERARRARDLWLARAGLVGQLDSAGYRAMQVGVLLGAAVLALGGSLWWVGRLPAAPGLALVVVLVLVCAAAPLAWISDRIKRREQAMLRDLPFALQLTTLGLQSGMSLGASVALAVDKLPAGALLEWMQRLLVRIQAGQSPAAVLRDMAQEVHLPAIQNWAAAVAIAQWQGASLADVFRHQAHQVNTDRFLRAERLALEAPVKLLFPLALFVFPSAFIVLFFPVITRLLQEGFL